jgi:hypothetical protein
VPSTSFVGAFIELYETLAFSPRPAIYFDEAPLDRTATTVAAYVVLKDEGVTVTYDAEYHPYETARLRFEIYAPTLAAADLVASGIRYNGGAPSARAGFDFTELLPMTGFEELDVRRVSEVRTQEAARGVGGALVFHVSMAYAVKGYRTA